VSRLETSRGSPMLSSSQESNAVKVGIPLTEKIYIFICIGLIKIDILFMKPNRPYDEMYMLWDDLINFDYV
jgi:hypothetical protein